MMDIVLFILSITLIAVAVGMQLRLFRFADPIDSILGYMVLFGANIVLATLVLSELNVISGTGYLVVQVVIVAISWIVVSASGSFSRKRRREVRTAKPVPVDSDRVTRYLIWIFLAAMMLVALINVFVAVYVPPNSWDSMTYHLSRVGYWLQHKTLHHYYSQDFRQTSMPPNMEILFLWTIAFVKSDILVNLFSWFLYLGLGLLIYQTSRILGAEKHAALFSALVFLSLPIVVLASNSSKNDITVVFFTLAFFYYFHSGLKNRDNGKLVISGIALGLAVGAKATIFFVAPGIVIASLVVAFSSKVKPAIYGKWLAYCFLGILVLGAYNYVQNYLSYANPFAPKSAVNWFYQKPGLKNAAINAVRYGYEAMDFRGLPGPLTDTLDSAKTSLGERFLLSNPDFQEYIQGQSGSFTLRSRRLYHEAYEWFGFLGFFLYVPVVFVFFFRIISRRRDAFRWTYAFISVFCFLYLCAGMGYAHNRGGKFLFSVAFTAPLVSSLFSIKKRPVRVGVLALTALIAVNTAWNASTLNQLKLLKSPRSFIGKDYYRKRAHAFARVIPFMRFIEEVTPKGCRIGHVTSVMDWDYLLFARDFSREVIPIKKAVAADGNMEVFDTYNLDFLVLRQDRSESGDSLHPIFPGVLENAAFRVIPEKDWNYVLNEALDSSVADPDRKRMQLKEIFDSCLNTNTPAQLLSMRQPGGSDIQR